MTHLEMHENKHNPGRINKINKQSITCYPPRHLTLLHPLDVYIEMKDLGAEKGTSEAGKNPNITRPNHTRAGTASNRNHDKI